MVLNPASNKVYGPFLGEFGWEVAQWAPYVNAMAGDTDRIMCQPGHAPLYLDGIPISQSSPRPRDGVPDMLRCSGASNAIGILGQVHPDRLKIKLVKGVPCIDAKLLPIPLYPACPLPRSFLVLHCRDIGKCPERNMTKEKWNALVRLICSEGHHPPVVIGSMDDYCPPLCNDRRGPLHLDETIDWMRQAKVVVGASSGPMHLAQACEAPIVVWSGNAAKDKPRYKDVWNHFDSPTAFVSSSWAPGVNKIMKAINDAF